MRENITPTIDPDEIEEGHVAACYGADGLPCDDCAFYWAGDAEEVTHR